MLACSYLSPEILSWRHRVGESRDMRRDWLARLVDRNLGPEDRSGDEFWGKVSECHPIRGMGNAVNSPSAVWGAAPATDGFYSARNALQALYRLRQFRPSVRLSVRPSVRLSVRHTTVLCQNDRQHVARCCLHRWIAKCV